MAKSKFTKKKGEENKYLYIKVKGKPIPALVEDYCHAVGMSPQTIGYNTGYILSARDDLSGPLVSLNQLFFFAGIKFAMENKSKIQYEYQDKKPHDEEVTDILKKMNKNAQDQQNYVG